MNLHSVRNLSALAIVLTLSACGSGTPAKQTVNTPANTNLNTGSTALVQNANSAASSAEMLLYKNTKYGYEFSYPMDHTVWEKLDEKSGKPIPATASSAEAHFAEQENLLKGAEAPGIHIRVIPEQVNVMFYRQTKYSEMRNASQQTISEQPALILDGAGNIGEPYRVILLSRPGYLMEIVQDTQRPGLDSVLASLTINHASKVGTQKDELALLIRGTGLYDSHSAQYFVSYFGPTGEMLPGFTVQTGMPQFGLWEKVLYRLTPEREGLVAFDTRTLQSTTLDISDVSAGNPMLSLTQDRDTGDLYYLQGTCYREGEAGKCVVNRYDLKSGKVEPVTTFKNDILPVQSGVQLLRFDSSAKKIYLQAGSGDGPCIGNAYFSYHLGDQAVLPLEKVTSCDCDNPGTFDSAAEKKECAAQHQEFEEILKKYASWSEMCGSMRLTGLDNQITVAAGDGSVSFDDAPFAGCL